MPTTKYIKTGNFIDGTGAPVQRNIYLEIGDTLIRSIGRKEDLPPIPAETIIDLSHCTIVPAMIDCSISLSSSPALVAENNPETGAADQVQIQQLIRKHVQFCLAHGVLGVVCPESESRVTSTDAWFNDNNIRELLTIRGMAPLNSMQAAHKQEDASPDFVKIDYSGSIEEYPVVQRMTRDDLFDLAARRKNAKIIIRANGQQAVREALQAGCDCIEQGYAMGTQNLQTMAQNKVLWIPSLLRARNGLDSSTRGGAVCCRFSLQYTAPGEVKPGAQDYWKATFAGQLEQLKLARNLGVETAVGTGAGQQGILHGESVAEEIKLFLKAGYRLEEALQCACRPSAVFFHMDSPGPLTVGRKATFLVTRGTAGQLPRKLSYLEAIYINGAPSSLYRKDPLKAS